jgi:hypothetical protein
MTRPSVLPGAVELSIARPQARVATEADQATYRVPLLVCEGLRFTFDRAPYLAALEEARTAGR